ncbi:MAG: response regulator [Acidobacteria bacterium]|nr:response regulator [Acidobacteriota bacterium]
MSLSPATILVVDDDQDSREYLALCFSHLNYKVIQATNGIQALTLAKSTQPDVIVLDVVMPDLDGYQVCHELKSDEKTAHIPIILITVLRKLEDEIRGFEAGAHDYISKPYNRAELSARITAALRVKRLQDQLLHRNEALKELLKVLQRDITDPLTGVLGRTTLMLRQPLTEDVSEGLHTIETLAKRIAKLIKHLDKEIKDIS